MMIDLYTPSFLVSDYVDYWLYINAKHLVRKAANTFTVVYLFSLCIGCSALVAHAARSKLPAILLRIH